MTVAGSTVEFEIQTLTAADAAEFWALRLRALRDHPEAFGHSYRESRLVPAAEVAARFGNDWLPPNGVLLGAVVEGALVGVVGLRRFDPEPQRHKATVRAVYVAPEHRGRGIARALLEAAIAAAESLPGVEQLRLSVGAESPAARRLYRSLGFEPWGIERRATKLADRYIDEEQMVLFLGGEAPSAP